jgi:hypothetical protein
MGCAGTDEKKDQIPLDAADFVRDVEKLVHFDFSKLLRVRKLLVTAALIVWAQLSACPYIRPHSRTFNRQVTVSTPSLKMTVAHLVAIPRVFSDAAFRCGTLDQLRPFPESRQHADKTLSGSTGLQLSPSTEIFMKTSCLPYAFLMLKSLISVSACVSRIAMQAAGKQDGKEDEVSAPVAKHPEQ